MAICTALSDGDQAHLFAARQPGDDAHQERGDLLGLARALEQRRARAGDQPQVDLLLRRAHHAVQRGAADAGGHPCRRVDQQILRNSLQLLAAATCPTGQTAAPSNISSFTSCVWLGSWMRAKEGGAAAREKAGRLW